jgi:hypothetical protein
MAGLDGSLILAGIRRKTGRMGAEMRMYSKEKEEGEE